MNIRDLIQTANANLLRSKIRTALTIISIFVGALTISLTVGITSGISSYINSQLGNVGAENVLLVQPAVDQSISSGPEEYKEDEATATVNSPFMMPMVTTDDIQKIKSQANIAKVTPVIYPSIEYVQYADNSKYVISASSFIDGTNIDLVAGQIPNNDSQELQIVLPEDYIETLGLGNAQESIGKILSITVRNTASSQSQTIDATVTGVQAKSLLTSGGASGNTALLEALNNAEKDGLPDNLKNSYIAVATQLTNADEETIESTKTALGELGYSAQTVQDQIGIINQIINAITAVLLFFGAIALLAASFGIINTLYMSVQERTKEIGLMKAMGMSKGRVFILFSIEAILIGFWGSLTGILASIGIGKIANNIASNGFLKDFTGFDLTSFPLTSLLPIMLVIMFIAFLAGTLPSRKAAKQDAIEALKYE